MSTDTSQIYQLAMHINSNPNDLELLFSRPDALKIFAGINNMLKPVIKKKATSLASRLIVKMASQVTNVGYRSGPLEALPLSGDYDDIDLDRSIENYFDHPDKPLHEQLIVVGRKPIKRSFVLMIDHSYSMKGLKLILSALTAASTALYFKDNFAIVAFSSSAKILKRVNQYKNSERILDDILSLELSGDTNIYEAMEKGLQEMQEYKNKVGLLLTDGCWNKGPDPLGIASKFDRLSVICFPPARKETIEELAVRGKGSFFYVDGENKIVRAIATCLN